MTKRSRYWTALKFKARKQGVRRGGVEGFHVGPPSAGQRWHPVYLLISQIQRLDILLSTSSIFQNGIYLSVLVDFEIDYPVINARKVGSKQPYIITDQHHVMHVSPPRSFECFRLAALAA